MRGAGSRMPLSIFGPRRVCARLFPLWVPGSSDQEAGCEGDELDAPVPDPHF